MSVTVLVKLSLADGKFDDLMSHLNTMLVDTRAREGCESMVVYRDQHNPNKCMFVEQWRTLADFEHYIGWRTERGDLDVLMSFLTGPPSASFFDAVSV